MLLEFTKMSGAGNDFIVADNRRGLLSPSREQVARLCHRQFGVGADGLMLLTAHPTGNPPWAWQFWNSDGSDAEMCGNGARCFARFIQHTLGTSPSEPVSFATAAGTITAHFENNQVTVNLTPPRDLQLDQSIPTQTGTVTVHSLNTGVPHAVVMVPDADQAQVQEEGRRLRFHPHFGSRGTNVNFVQVLAPGRIRVRTYERGVEGETLACGTGVTASALVASRCLGFPSPIEVQVQSGNLLRVQFNAAPHGFENVRLSGPADFVFEGRIHL